MSVFATAAPNAEPSSRRWLVLAVVATATLLTVLDASVVNVALPQAQADLRIADPDRHWIFTAYAVAFGSLLLIGGRVVDGEGRRRVLVMALLGFALASLVGGVAVSGAVLFAARAAQGLFAAALVPASLAILGATFADGGERLRAFSVFGAVQGLGGALGLLIGGALTQYAGWRWCMFVNVPLAAAVAAAALALIAPDGRHGQRRYDPVGAVLVTSAAALLVLGLTWAGEGEAGWQSRRASIGVGAAVLLGVAFAWWQGRHPGAMLPLRIVRNRLRACCYLAALLSGGGMFAALILMTLFLQQRLGLPALATGLAFLPFSVGIVGSALLAPRVVGMVGEARTILLGLGIALLGALWFLRVDPGSSFVTLILPGEALIATGLGLAFTPMNAVALHGTDAGDAGTAGAVLTMAQQLGGAVGVALMNTVLALDAGPGAYRGGFVVVLAALALAVAAIVPATLSHHLGERRL